MRGILLAAYMSTPRYGHCRFVRLLTLSLAALATPIQAQYFGRNKVQYESFDFRVLKTEHFDIYFYPPEEAAPQPCSTDGGAVVRPVVEHPRPRAVRPPAADPLRQRTRVPADQRSRRQDRRGHWRGHGGPPPPDRAAHRRDTWRPGPRYRTRVGSCLSIRHHRQRKTRRPRSAAYRDSAPAVVHRGYGGVPLDRPSRHHKPRCGCAERWRIPGGTRFPHSASWTTPATSPTGTGTRSWPGSRGIGGIRSSVSCCGAPAAGATLRWHSPRC